MDYTLDRFQYDLFIAEEMMQQVEMERYINECVLISEGTNTIANIQVLNESFTDKLKEIIKKIAQAISRVWARFIEAMTTLVTKDKTYLEKYKDIILKKTPKEADYEMFDYPTGIKRIVASPVPLFNYEQMRDALESDEKFIQASTLKNYLIPNSKEAYLDQFKSYFRGGTSTKIIKSTQFNMTDAYNYCINYKSMENTLKKDRNEIEKAGLAAITLIDNMVKSGEVKNESLFESPLYYSVVYEQFIHEEEQPAGSTGTENKGQPGVKISAPGTGGTDVAKDAMNNKTGETDKDQESFKKAVVDGEKNASENINRIKRYLSLCGGLMGAKQTVCEEIYKAYMTIIRAHVRDFVGTKNKEDDKPKDASTTYSSETPEQGAQNGTNNTPPAGTQEKKKPSLLKKLFSWGDKE